MRLPNAGRLLPEYFPKIFGPSEKEPLDKEGTEKAFAKLTEEINEWHAKQGHSQPLTPDEARRAAITQSGAVTKPSAYVQ